MFTKSYIIFHFLEQWNLSGKNTFSSSDRNAILTDFDILTNHQRYKINEMFKISAFIVIFSWEDNEVQETQETVWNYLQY